MKVVIYSQYVQEATSSALQEVVTFFSEIKAAIFVQTSIYGELLPLLKKDVFIQELKENQQLDASFDCLISIGGDGTVLRSVTLVKDSGVPILAINTGRLGFLANVSADAIRFSLEQLVAKQYTLSPRTLLALKTIPENDAILKCNYALNEVAVSRKDTTSMIRIETLLDGEYLNSYWADGLIVSTPTGSTGYSLSCGGPVLTPTVSSLVINPISPHNLNARPLVISDTTEVQLQVSGRENQFLVSLDSRISTIDQDTVLIIKKNPFHINLIQLYDESFLKTLRKKLLWGEDRRN